jgi:hypothetical protein
MRFCHLRKHDKRENDEMDDKDSLPYYDSLHCAPGSWFQQGK